MLPKLVYRNNSHENTIFYLTPQRDYYDCD